MTAKRATLTLALTAALVLAGQPASAQHHGGGGHYGRAGQPGGSYAVPRGSGGYGGGVAQGRHPQAGTGGYGYHHYSPYYGGHYSHGYYGRGYGHGYGGYYGRYGYYRPYGYASFYFGWPYVNAGWWPYDWAGYYPSYYAPYYGYSGAPPVREYERTYDVDRYSSDRDYPDRRQASDNDSGRLRLEVTPDDASVYVDDSFQGTGREARYLTLRSGRHAIEVVRPGFDTVRRDVEVVRGETGDVQVELQRH